MKVYYVIPRCIHSMAASLYLYICCLHVMYSMGLWPSECCVHIILSVYVCEQASVVCVCARLCLCVHVRGKYGVVMSSVANMVPVLVPKVFITFDLFNVSMQM